MVNVYLSKIIVEQNILSGLVRYFTNMSNYKTGQIYQLN